MKLLYEFKRLHNQLLTYEYLLTLSYFTATFIGVRIVCFSGKNGTKLSAVTLLTQKCSVISWKFGKDRLSN